jgi:hypothetical protein
MQPAAHAFVKRITTRPPPPRLLMPLTSLKFLQLFL